MNRSCCHSQKQYSVNLNRSIKSRRRSSRVFRTLWKYRDTHQTYIPNKLITTSNKPLNTQPFQHLATKISASTSHQFPGKHKMLIKKNSNPQIKFHKIQPQQSSNIFSLNTSMLGTHQKVKYIGDDIYLSLQQLQKKIQQLIKLKLIIRKSSKNSSPTHVQQHQLQLQFNQLIEQVKNYQNKTKQNLINNQINNQSQLVDINKKIIIIEKAIAQYFTQSQICKKYYSSTCKKRKQFAVLDRNFKKSMEKSIPRNLSHSSLSNSGIFLHHQTTNMSSYPIPPKTSYMVSRKKENNFVGNRQPLPRSTYQRQYLNLGRTPPSRIFQFGQKKNQNPLKIYQSMKSPSQKQSTYKQQYPNKKAPIIDTKLLDCRHDKYKNLNINFNTINGWKKQQNKQNISHDLKLKKKTKVDLFQSKQPIQQYQTNQLQQHQIYMNPLKMSTSSILFTINNKSGQNVNYKTQYSSQFQLNKSILQSKIKNINLNHFKSLYQTQFFT